MLTIKIKSTLLLNEYFCIYVGARIYLVKISVLPSKEFCVLSRIEGHIQKTNFFLQRTNLIHKKIILRKMLVYFCATAIIVKLCLLCNVFNF